MLYELAIYFDWYFWDETPLVQGHICRALSEKQILAECAIGNKQSQQTVWNKQNLCIKEHTFVDQKPNICRSLNMDQILAEQSARNKQLWHTQHGINICGSKKKHFQSTQYKTNGNI